MVKVEFAPRTGCYEIVTPRGIYAIPHEACHKDRIDLINYINTHKIERYRVGKRLGYLSNDDVQKHIKETEVVDG